MSSSTSSSSCSPSLTVVIGSVAPPGRLCSCLEALEAQLDDGVEVRVHESSETPREIRQRFPWASYTTSPGNLVPHHWRDGIDAARGEIVALTIAQMIPAPNWIAEIRRRLGDGDVVGGAIDPAPGIGLVDWGEYFCRYARDMQPFRERETPDLASDNAAYRRSRLDAVSDAYRNGFWEQEVNRLLAAGGTPLRQTPELVVLLGRSAGFMAFAVQRWQHGQEYGRRRGGGFSAARAALGVVATPVVPLLMTWRVVRLVIGKRKHRARLVAALPLLLTFDAVWAAGEAGGYLHTLRRNRKRETRT